MEVSFRTPECTTPRQLTDRPTDRPTTWNRVLLEYLTVTQIIKKFHGFYGTRMFITVFTTGHHWSLS